MSIIKLSFQRQLSPDLLASPYPNHNKICFKTVDDSKFSWLRIRHEQSIGTHLVRVVLALRKNFLNVLAIQINSMFQIRENTSAGGGENIVREDRQGLRPDPKNLRVTFQTLTGVK